MVVFAGVATRVLTAEAQRAQREDMAERRESLSRREFCVKSAKIVAGSALLLGSGTLAQETDTIHSVINNSACGPAKRPSF